MAVEAGKTNNIKLEKKRKRREKRRKNEGEYDQQIS